jgi:E-phenylitaconyl-CoA hydratase
VQAAKELALRGASQNISTGLRLEQFVNHLLQRTDDASEGRSAFSEKRPASFKGS